MKVKLEDVVVEKIGTGPKLHWQITAGDVTLRFDPRMHYQGTTLSIGGVLIRSKGSDHPTRHRAGGGKLTSEEYVQELAKFVWNYSDLEFPKRKSSIDDTLKIARSDEDYQKRRYDEVKAYREKVEALVK